MYSDYILQSEQHSNDDILTNASLRVQQNAARASLTFILVNIYEKIYHRSLKVAHSLGDGLYCIDLDKIEITEEMLNEIKAEFDNFMKNNHTIEIVKVPRFDLLKKFKEENREDKIGVLKTISDNMVRVRFVQQGFGFENANANIKG